MADRFRLSDTRARRWGGALAVMGLLALGAGPLMVPGPLQAQDTGTAIEGELVDTDQRVEVDGAISDSKIAARIGDILEATGWYDDPEVKVSDGIVFLDGDTATEQRQIWARDLAAKTDGVVAVVNRIEVLTEVEFSVDPAVSELRKIYDKALANVPLIVMSLLILPLAWLLARWVARLVRWLTRGRMRSPFLSDVVARLVALPVLLLGIYLVLQIAGLTQLAVSVIGGAGVIGIVIGFAFRDIAENFLASVLLSLRQPFRRGDFVAVSGHEGVIHSMNTRSTVLVSPEGNHIQIPNSVIFKSTIENFTASPLRRGSFDLGIGYDAAISEAQDLILHVLTSHDAILADPEPMVLADALGAATVNIKIYYWFDGQSVSPLKLKSNLIRLVKKALAEAGVTMPDEAREVIFPDGIPVTLLPNEGGAAAPQAEAAPQDAVTPEPVLSVSEEDLSNEVADLDVPMEANVEGDKDDDLLGN